MRFLEPGRLWLLLLPAALVVAYVLAQRARRRYAVRFTNVDLLASIAPKRPGWRRHVTAAGLLAALVLLTGGFARPVVERQVPKERAAIILALDVSTSMAAEDVEPNRLVAAQRAATEFAQSLPERLQLGLVTFSRSATLHVPPTTDRALVTGAIASLTLGSSTATGEAIFTSLSAIEAHFADTEEVAAHVIVMSDGETTSGRPNAEAAAAAVAAGVPVTTIAYGTDEGTVTVGGQTISVPVDREALREIAETTSGRFFEAADADQLRGVYEDIGQVVGYDTEEQEVTDAAVGLALLAATAAAAGSLVWLGRLP